MDRTHLFTAALLLLSGARVAAQQAAPRGTIELRVIARGTSVPVPFADVAIASERFAAFTDSAGRLLVHYLPARPLQLRVRRIGFQPVTTAITPAANRTTPVVVALPMVALRLTEVKVSGDVCPGGGTADTAVVTILEQARLNAERYALLAARYPFALTMERVFAEQGSVPIHWSGRSRARRGDRRIQAHDTVDVTGRSEWRYAPGRLIIQAGDTIDGLPLAREKMIVPHLVDFADDAFVASHCFRYAGLADADSGRKVFRVDFRPTRELRSRDVRGSLYFDPATYQIRKSTLFAERPAPSAPATDVWLVRVDAWFTEILPGIPVLHRIESTTSLESGRRIAARSMVATEDHRMLDVRFRHERPGDGSRGEPEAQADDSDAAMSFACPTHVPLPVDSTVLEVEGATVKVCFNPVAQSGDAPVTLLLGREMEVGGLVLASGRYEMRAFSGPAQDLVRFFVDTTGAPMELGRGTAALDVLDQATTAYAVRADSSSVEPALIIEWRSLRARLPVWSRR